MLSESYLLHSVEFQSQKWDIFWIQSFLPQWNILRQKPASTSPASNKQHFTMHFYSYTQLLRRNSAVYCCRWHQQKKAIYKCLAKKYPFVCMPNLGFFQRFSWKSVYFSPTRFIMSLLLIMQCSFWQTKNNATCPVWQVCQVGHTYETATTGDPSEEDCSISRNMSR